MKLKAALQWVFYTQHLDENILSKGFYATWHFRKSACQTIFAQLSPEDILFETTHSSLHLNSLRTWDLFRKKLHLNSLRT
jgi:hypothetical protein